MVKRKPTATSEVKLTCKTCMTTGITPNIRMCEEVAAKFKYHRNDPILFLEFLDSDLHENGSKNFEIDCNQLYFQKQGKNWTINH